MFSFNREKNLINLNIFISINVKLGQVEKVIVCLVLLIEIIIV